jgi:ATP-binding cassette subfamily B protein
MKKQQKIDYKKIQNSPIAFLRIIAKQKKWAGIIAAVAVLLAGISQAVLYPLIGKITDSANLYESEPQILFKLFIIFFVTVIAGNIFYRISGYFASFWVLNVEVFATQISFDYLIGHSAGYFADRLSGKLQNKISNITMAIHAMFITLLWEFFNLVIRMTSITIIAFLTNVLIGWMFVVFFVVAVIYNMIASKKLSHYSKQRAEKSSQVSGEIVDVIGNMLAVKQNNTQNKESSNIAKTLEKYRAISMRAWRYFDTTILFNNLIAIGMFGAIVFVSLRLLNDGIITIGDVVMLFTMFLMIYSSLEFLSMSLNRFMENYGKLKDGLKTIFMPYDIEDDKKAQSVNITKGSVVFDKVNFQYDKKNTQIVLRDVSLNIPVGQKVGLVGESGAGKTTFVKLLLRFMDVESGVIKIGGYDITKIKQNDLRRSITYVPQEALLFHRTLEENILYSKSNATKEERDLAVERAYATDFINMFPKKFKTLVGERGIKLSGGQKQRLMIARAMMRNAPIIVLDEATSALDSMSEKYIQDALENLMEDKTAIVVAHRLSTLKQMDRIIVFDGGKIIEDGTHKELLNKKGKYWELWQHQVGSFN